MHPKFPHPSQPQAVVIQHFKGIYTMKDETLDKREKEATYIKL